MFLVVFNVMASHYGDWLPPGIQRHPKKVISWDSKENSNQVRLGQPFWPLLQPLGREDFGAGIAMSLAFLVNELNAVINDKSKYN